MKVTKKADAPHPSLTAAELSQKVQEVQEASKKKPQYYDKQGRPCYVEPSDAAKLGKKATMLALGLKAKMSPS